MKELIKLTVGAILMPLFTLALWSTRGGNLVAKRKTAKGRVSQ